MCVWHAPGGGQLDGHLRYIASAEITLADSVRESRTAEHLNIWLACRERWLCLLSSMHASVSAPAAAHAAIRHYTVEPFSILPPTVIDAILQRLNRLNLAECSLVCKAWRHLPFAYLYHLRISSYNAAPQASLLQMCCNLKEIRVSSNTTEQWAPLAVVLAAHQLPSLRLLAIQHSSHTSTEQLQQLQNIMQVQGPRCCLHLAITDKASLQALIPLLPFPGLAQLDFNVPYLPEGAAALLAEAAALQAATASSTHHQQQQQQQRLQGPADTAAAATAAAAAASGNPDMQQDTQKQPQAPFTVGVWVCCWGGCPGISLPDVLHVQSWLQAVGCSIHCMESINCSSNDDVVALGQAAQHFNKLTSLGFNYKASGSTRTQSSRMADTAAPALPSATNANTTSQFSGSSDVGSQGVASQLELNTAALTALVPLADSLQKLTVHGCPDAGFGQGTATASVCAGPLGTTCGHCPSSSAVEHEGHATVLPAAAAAAAAGYTGTSTAPSSPHSQLHPLAALTSLTKLSLLKQWHTWPMPIGPIAHLTGLVELAIERERLVHRAELSCLSRLTNLKVLSLVLTVTAEDLEFEMEEGMSPCQRQVLGVSQHQTSSTQQQLDSRMQNMQLGQQQAAAGMHCCNCCCGSTVHAAEVTASPVPAAGGTVKGAQICTPHSLSSMLQGVTACPCSPISSPAFLDWEWVRQLRCLETAWLQVPHLDIACLPSSLTELDAQQPRDVTAVSITCSSSGSAGSVQLPNIRRLVLPRTMEVTSTCGCNSDSHTEDGEGNEQGGLQAHYNALLLLKLCAASPELRELELVQWQLPAPVVQDAVKQLRHIGLLSLLQPDRKEDAVFIQNGLSNAAGGAVNVKLQDRLVLSSYPWSSVLDVR